MMFDDSVLILDNSNIHKQFLGVDISNISLVHFNISKREIYNKNIIVYINDRCIGKILKNRYGQLYISSEQEILHIIYSDLHNR